MLKEGLPHPNETPAWFKKYKIKKISKSVMKTLRAGADKVREALD